MADRTSSLSLFTDLYQLTMAQAYWQSGQKAEATFSLFFRNLPPDRGYLVLAGITDALDYLEALSFSAEDIDHLSADGRFDQDFLEWLRDLRFTGKARAMEEGEVFFAGEPVIEVTAPIIEAQIVETYLINQINFQSLLATKAARVVHAARGRTVVDFAARRTHGIDSANSLARASYVVGFAGTSNVMAGKLYGIPTSGTMAHSFVTAFGLEKESFRAYATSFPDSTTLLVDTYGTVDGVRKAIEIGRELESRGRSLRAVRLDSGDLVDLSKKSRALLDDAGLGDVQVLASGGLDEFEVDRLVRAGAPIDAFGVGTKVGVSADAPWTDCAYKLVQYGGRPVLKLSAGKQSAPGAKQVFRYQDARGRYTHDVVGLAEELSPQPGDEPLLKEVMRQGKRLEAPLTLDALRQRFREKFDRLPKRYKALRSPSRFRVATSKSLERLTQRVVEEVTTRELEE